MTAGAPRADQSHPRRLDLLQQVGRPLRAFLSTEAGSAGQLVAAVLIALVWANSPASESYVSVWSAEVSMRAGDAELSMQLREWVTDGLMFFFFLVIGLEVRRELAMGELTDRRTVAVPAIAAVGGVLLPAAIYLAINPRGEPAAAWGAVIGTDTAFLLGALALIGAGRSTPLRVFLLTLTIFDDVVAVIVIAVFYAEGVDTTALMLAVGSLLVVLALGRLRVWRAAPYVLVGLVLWLATVRSGLHPAIGGMAMGLAVSAYPPRREAVEHAAALAGAFRQSPMAELARSARSSVARALSPNERIQTALHPWTSHVIVPLFALANAGVDLREGILADALSSPVTWGVFAGLVGGKVLGVGGSTLAAVRLGAGRLPRGVGPGQLLAGAALSGIGFTVSMLIIEVSLDDPALREEAKVGVLAAGVGATLLGWATFRVAMLLGESTEPPSVLDPPVDPRRDHVRGRTGAPLTLLEFADFECHFCGQVTGVVEDLRRRFGDELRYVYRHLPLTDVHEHAELAAEASEAAGAQGRFWEYHDMLFRHQDELEFEDLLGYAGELELDVESFARELEHGVHADRVVEDVLSAESSGARATPTFFVGGRRHVGRHDAEALAAALEASRPQPPDVVPACAKPSAPYSRFGDGR
jgi:Na+/H+ antiporter NhaA